jgi:hypothetical protein
MFRITRDNDFLRVFEIPKRFPLGYCFMSGPKPTCFMSGAKPTCFMMYDWFQVWNEVNLPIACEPHHELYMDRVNRINENIMAKPYYDMNKKFLIIADWGDAWIL